MNLIAFLEFGRLGWKAFIHEHQTLPYIYMFNVLQIEQKPSVTFWLKVSLSSKWLWMAVDFFLEQPWSWGGVDWALL